MVRGPAGKPRIDYKALGTIGKQESFFSTPAYKAGEIHRVKKAKSPVAGAKKAKGAKAKKRSSGPTYAFLVREAVGALETRAKAASLVAIKNHIAAAHKAKSDPLLIVQALRKCVADGSLVRDAASFRLGAAAAKAAAPMKKKARAAPRKSKKAAPVAAVAAAAAAPVVAAAAAAAVAAPVVAKRASRGASMAKDGAAPKKKGAAAKVFDDKSKADVVESGFKWQYFDAAKGGWNDFDSAASDVVDAAYVEWLANPYTDVRAIHSGQWSYQVDFTNMRQQNIQHEAHTQRDVRRTKK